MKIEVKKLKKESDKKCEECLFKTGKARKAQYVVVERYGWITNFIYLCKRHLKSRKSVCEEFIREIEKLGVEE